jgi:hypothetical protein
LKEIEMASPTYEASTKATEASTKATKASAAEAGDAARDDAARNGSLGTTVSDAAGTVRVAAGDAVSRLPEVAATTRLAIEDANRQMRAGSDEMLTIGSVMSFGFAMGLLLGGASRLLVAVALIPSAMMGLTLLDRSSRARSGAPSLQDR